MSTRLQVILNDDEMADLRRKARLQHMTVAEWVRQALRRAKHEQPEYEASRKLRVVREAARNQYPSGDINEMLSDIARGQQEGLDS
ncbi:MAG: hypothetical protein BWY59_01767 [Verrucomicrobia bacterium ADurb.Bin345]|nr:MAG: hypothetical protein BWY59_01767 [Verrucomicrobia bacterium ADurb.Bin345]